MNKKIDGRSTLVDVLRERAARHPDRVAFIFLADGEAQEIKLTYGEMSRRVSSVAGGLQQISQVGDRALMLFPSGLDFMIAFLGCLYAGVVAVPAVIPPLNRPAPRLQMISKNAGAKIALTTPDVIDSLDRRFANTPGLSVLQWLNCSELVTNKERVWSPPQLSGENLAFLQYTSGSTADPKGVMVSHYNLLYMEELLKQVWGHDETTAIVNWMPLHHDGGLIGMALQAIYSGATCVLMSAVDFMQKPSRWLQAISRYKAYTSAGPNFSYDLCVRTMPAEQCEGLDLGSWRVAVNSAEPIRVNTIRQFTQKFEPYGFRPETFYPCYGLAEGTLFVTGGYPSDFPVIRSFQKTLLADEGIAKIAVHPQTGQELVSSGRIVNEQEIVIADPNHLGACEAGQVGEIWISSPAVAGGYWGNPQETKRAFQAYLADSGQGPFMRTGDLGFLHQGELFITGRHKDLIIIQGNNYYPQDIENIAIKSAPALEEDGCAAFSIEVDNQECLVIVAEIKRVFRKKYRMDEIVDQICLAVAGEFGIQVYAIVVLKPMRLPKTTSGKVQRFACRAEFLDGRLEELDRWVAHISTRRTVELSPDILDSIVTQAFLDVLGVSDIGKHDNFFTAGGDSLLFVELCERIERQTGCNLPIDRLIQAPTIASMTDNLAQACGQELSQTSIVSMGSVKPTSLMIAVKILTNQDLTIRQRLNRLSVLAQDIIFWLGKGLVRFAVPYQQGSALIKWFCSQGLVRRIFYHRQVKLLQRIMAHIGIRDSRKELLHQSLVVNSWRRWRIGVLANLPADQFEQYVEISGLENFQTHYKKGRGVILLHAHTAVAMLDLLVLQRQGVSELMVVGNRPYMIDLLGLSQYREQLMLGADSLLLTRQQVNASQLLAGRQTLERGGVLSIAADGYRGAQFITQPFHGRMRPFGIGFAELALASAAPALPVRVTIDLDGQINIRFYPALEVRGDSHPERVESLVRGYREWFEAIWVDDFANTTWTHLKKFLQLPLESNLKDEPIPSAIFDTE